MNRHRDTVPSMPETERRAAQLEQSAQRERRARWIVAAAFLALTAFAIWISVSVFRAGAAADPPTTSPTSHSPGHVPGGTTNRPHTNGDR